MNEATHAYIGVKECGCIVAAVVDNPEHYIDTANTLAGWGRRKLTPQRVTVEEARTLLKRCTHQQKKRRTHTFEK